MWSAAQSAWLASGAGLNIDLDFTLIIQLALFIGLWIILTKALFKPYIAARHEREAKTEGARKDASELQERADVALDRYREVLTEARTDAAKKRAEVVGVGEAEATKVIEQARGDAQRVREDADASLEKELGEARQTVRTEAETLSTAIANRILA